MLNVFALVLVEWIFTMTPPSLARAGLDVMLSQLLEQDEKKEGLCRAMLLSVTGGGSSQDREIQQLVKYILDAFGILLPSKSRADFKSDVKSLISDASNCWAKTRLNRQKLTTTLDFELYSESWEDLPMPNHKHQQRTADADASDPEDQEEVCFVAFPAVIMKSGGTRTTIYKGTLVRFCHLYEAEIEWRNELGKARFSRSKQPNLLGLPSLPSIMTPEGSVV